MPLTMKQRNARKMKRLYKEYSEKSLSKFVTVPEDWYPCYPGNQVKVRLWCVNALKGQFLWGVAVWGADDFGMQIEFEFSEENFEEKFNEAKEFYDLVFDGVTKKELKEIGFVPV